MKPCPFCGAALNPVAGPSGKVSGYAHPKGSCYYQGVFVGANQADKWNTRAAATGGVWMEIEDDVPKFNDDGRGQHIGAKMINDIMDYYRSYAEHAKDNRRT